MRQIGYTITGLSQANEIRGEPSYPDVSFGPRADRVECIIVDETQRDLALSQLERGQEQITLFRP